MIWLPIPSVMLTVMLTLSPTYKLVVLTAMLIVAFCLLTVISAVLLLSKYSSFWLYVTLTFKVLSLTEGIVTFTLPFTSTSSLTISSPLSNTTVMLPVLTGNPVVFVTVTSIVTLPAVLFTMVISVNVGF